MHLGPNIHDVPNQAIIRVLLYSRLERISCKINIQYKVFVELHTITTKNIIINYITLFFET